MQNHVRSNMDATRTPYDQRRLSYGRLCGPICSEKDEKKVPFVCLSLPEGGCF